MSLLIHEEKIDWNMRVRRVQKMKLREGMVVMINHSFNGFIRPARKVKLLSVRDVGPEQCSSGILIKYEGYPNLIDASWIQSIVKTKRKTKRRKTK